jgi:hypothetical protein
MFFLSAATNDPMANLPAYENPGQQETPPPITEPDIGP